MTSLDLVYVRYYDHDLSEVITKVDRLKGITGVDFSTIVVIDNNLIAPLALTSTSFQTRLVTVIRGSGRMREFSGYEEGLEFLRLSRSQANILIINDSFSLNWDFSPLSGRIIQSAIRRVKDYDIVLPADFNISFSDFRFERLPNSRYFLVNRQSLSIVQEGLNRSIEFVGDRTNDLGANDVFRSRLKTFYDKNPGRMNENKIGAVYIEHNFASSLNFSYEPSSLLLAFFYAIYRRFIGEKR